MKAISLWQPWASLVATGSKRFETRSWYTNYRGPLLICSAKAGLSQSDIIAKVNTWEVQAGLAPLVGDPLDLTGFLTGDFHYCGISYSILPLGKAIAIVELLDCISTDRLTLGQIGTDLPFGDFSTGRYAWKLAHLFRIANPFPVRGCQGLFEVDVPDVFFRKFKNFADISARMSAKSGRKLE